MEFVLCFTPTIWDSIRKMMITAQAPLLAACFRDADSSHTIRKNQSNFDIFFLKEVRDETHFSTEQN
jgi:hypothetical protein